ncbi:serine/threonine-protein kinase [Candidatus Uabimicrobium amorphum]|uniref:non-specific serine/threonine protein kinase n=1 Tax=Uabimicrobium amorphum TaxID=2596890 RepID=A0A5S9IUA3_UABAM|nr:serine/threonine-protein kinase [Candidatus Uabimicrobium amorphum]BBM87700.1 protein kinase [Candidatus Uabimicrobium amorphum]
MNLRCNLCNEIYSFHCETCPKCSQKLFGELARDMNYLTDQQLQLAIHQHQQKRQPLGSLLVELNLLTWEQVTTILAKQKKIVVKCDSCRIVFNVHKEQINSNCAECNEPLRAATQFLPYKLAPFCPKESKNLPLVSNTPKNIFGHYEIYHEIGRGGMGRVYKTWDQKLRCVVAVKKVENISIDRRRFLREVQTIAQLNHPNIVRLLGFGEEPAYYIAMSYVQGKTLDKFIKEHPSFLDMIKIFQKLAEALDYAHKRGVIHRDIKPDNIVITPEQQPIIMDFGIAKAVDDTLKISHTGCIVGTPSYMSPQQARGEAVTHSTDIYSLGASFYEVLTGCCPFQGEHPHKIMLDLQEKEPILPTQIRADIPKELEAICLKCLDKKIEKRYQYARHIAVDLQNYIENRPISARKMTEVQKWIKNIVRNKVKYAVVTCLVFFAVLTIGYFLHITSEHNKQLQYERNAAVKNAQMTFAFLQKVYWKYELLRKDKNLVRSLKNLFGELERQNALSLTDEKSQEILWLYAIVYSLSDNKHERSKGFEAYSHFLSKFPTDARAYASRGIIHLRHKDFDKAISDFTKAISLQNKLSVAYYNRGFAYIRVKQYLKAIADLSATLKIEKEANSKINHHDFDRNNIYFNRGLAFFHTKSYQKALKDFDAVIKNRPQNMQAYLYRAQILENIYDYKNAIEDYSFLIKVNYETKLVYHRRAELYWKLQDVRWKEDLLKLISISGKKEKYLFWGDYYHYQKQFAKAISHYKQYTTYFPRKETGYVSIATALIQQQKFQLAISYLKKAMPLTQNNFDVYARIGSCYCVLQKYDQGMRYLKKAIEISPYRVGPYLDLGNCYWIKGDSKKALQCWENAAKMPSPQQNFIKKKILQIQAAIKEGNKK